MMSENESSITTAITSPRNMLSTTPEGFTVATDGSYAVTIDSSLTPELAIRGLADICNWEDMFSICKEQTKWVVARAAIAAQERFGDDVYQAFPEASTRTIEKALDTAREFTPEEVGGFQNLLFTHFQEVRFTGGLDHDERISILESADELALTSKATRELAKKYRMERDGEVDPPKPEFLVVDKVEGNSALAVLIGPSVMGGDFEVYTLGANPKRVIDFQIDGEAICEELLVIENTEAEDDDEQGEV